MLEIFLALDTFNFMDTSLFINDCYFVIHLLETLICCALVPMHLCQDYIHKHIHSFSWAVPLQI